MDLVPLCEPQQGLASPSPSACQQTGPIERRLAQAMNASELMYFFGAPLAHVVDYEDRLRANRCEKVVREVARSCRSLLRPADIVISPLQLAGRPGGANDA